MKKKRWVIGYNESGVYSQSGTATLLLKSNLHPYGSIEFRNPRNWR